MADNENNDHNEKLIARLTDRLAGDPELQADVARELQTHLEDAEDEFREAGLDEEEAQNEAVKALGDPEDISRQLFQANRTRMRFRAVVRWAASLALLPAAIGVVVFVVAAPWTPWNMPVIPQPWFTSIPRAWTRSLTEEQVFILQGDPQAKDYVARARSISDRWPDDPIYYGDYFVTAQGKFHRKDEKLPLDLWNERMALAEKGEKVDPDNAFYNFVKAAWLINASCTLEDDPSRTIESMNTNGEIKPDSLYTITITDPAGFQQGLKELHRGLQKPFYSSRTVDMLELRMSFLPPPRSMTDIISRITMQVSTLLPSLSDFRTLGKALGAYAVDLAEQGNPTAVKVARSEEQMADMIGAKSGTIIEILVAMAIRQNALANLELVGKELQKPALSKEAFQQRREQEELWRGLRNGNPLSVEELRHAGMFWTILTPAIAGYHVDFEPIRTVECFVVLEVALLLLLVGMVILSCGFGLVVLIWAIFCRRSTDKPILLFVGWRRIGKIVQVSIVIPLVAFGLYVIWQIYRSDAYGLNFTLGRWTVELVLLLCGVFALLLSMSYRAIRLRCLEVGLATPPSITRRKRIGFLIATGLILLVCGIYIVGWWAGPLRLDYLKGRYWIPPFAFVSALIGESGASSSPKFLIETFLAIVVLFFFVVWFLSEGVELFRRGRKGFRRTFIRSAMPILCAAVIVMGLALGGLLSLGERCAARRVTGSAAMSIQGEIERSDFRLLREKFIQWRQEDGK
ncbi:MAG: hypothetical protein JW849_09485 [Phycisphaerae bacterium]|nr:hypothetical protein [Phycisphaerae bacterium]